MFRPNKPKVQNAFLDPKSSCQESDNWGPTLNVQYRGILCYAEEQSLPGMLVCECPVFILQSIFHLAPIFSQCCICTFLLSLHCIVVQEWHALFIWMKQNNKGCMHCAVFPMPIPMNLCICSIFYWCGCLTYKPHLLAAMLVALSQLHRCLDA